MALQTVASNTYINWGNTQRAWELFFRRLGLKVPIFHYKNTSRKYDMADDDGTTDGRTIAIGVSTSIPVSSATNTHFRPTGLGDICVYCAINNFVAASKRTNIPIGSISIYRCSVYATEDSYTWVKIIPT